MEPHALVGGLGGRDGTFNHDYAGRIEREPASTAMCGTLTVIED